MKVTELFGFFSFDKNGEGLIGMSLKDQWMPFVGADMERIDQLRPFAIEIGLRTNKQVVLKKFKLVSEEGVNEETRSGSNN